MCNKIFSKIGAETEQGKNRQFHELAEGRGTIKKMKQTTDKKILPLYYITMENSKKNKISVGKLLLQ